MVLWLSLAIATASDDFLHDCWTSVIGVREEQFITIGCNAGESVRAVCASLTRLTNTYVGHIFFNEPPQRSFQASVVEALSEVVVAIMGRDGARDMAGGLMGWMCSKPRRT